MGRCPDSESYVSVVKSHVTKSLARVASEVFTTESLLQLLTVHNRQLKKTRRREDR